MNLTSSYLLYAAVKSGEGQKLDIPSSHVLTHVLVTIFNFHPYPCEFYPLVVCGSTITTVKCSSLHKSPPEDLVLDDKVLTKDSDFEATRVNPLAGSGP